MHSYYVVLALALVAWTLVVVLAVDAILRSRRQTRRDNIRRIRRYTAS